MAKYAQVIIDISHKDLDHPFTYRIPDSFADRVKPGSLLLIPFGKADKERKGYCIGISGRADLPEEKIKDILGIGTESTDVTGQNAIALAFWMKERYGSTMAAALKTVVTARKSAKPLESKTVKLLLGEKEAEEKLAFYEKKHQVARARLLSELIRTPEQPYSLITEKLHVTAPVMRAMKEQGVISIEVTSSLRNPVPEGETGGKRLPLGAGQSAAFQGVVRDFDALQRGESVPRVSLVFGITGSGKTEVYIRIAEEIVARGRQVIVLIPEISLTYQTLIRFYRHFGNRVSVMNSTLSEGEKSDQFERARKGGIDVIIGPRSALFTPFPHVGAIIIDEEHESSYKNEFMPKYHARDVAEKIAGMQNAVVVLGSATPSLESYYRAEKGEYRLYKLTERLTGGTLPAVHVEDMRTELREGNKTILSRRLSALLSDRLEKKEQSMLFINRRGVSGFVSCRSCGHVFMCPHCDVALSLHRNGKLVCHYCGYEEQAPTVCPSCGAAQVAGMKAGTEKIEEYLKVQFPWARILRMDADTTAKKGSYEKILTSFANEEADILLGTQMIVKGHDFPKVTLVGVLLADMSLYSNDYRSAERTFDLLTQAAGRAGRGVRPGDVVIQTYQPWHYAIKDASRQDYEGFFHDEMRYRRRLFYPPVSHMLAIQIFSKDDDTASLLAGRIRELLDKITSGINRHAGNDYEKKVIVIGPSRAGVGRISDVWRYAVYIKCAKYDTLRDCRDRVDAYARLVEDNAKAPVSVQFDFDPVNSF